MKFKRKPALEHEGAAGKSPRHRRHPAFRHARWSRGIAGFTLAEVLAALVFMAILIPVALEGLSIASRAGEVAVRKSEAALVAERILNESIVMTNWNSAVQNGTLRQGLREFRYSFRNDPWVQDPNQSAMRQLSVEVLFTAQGRDYSVKMSTLVDSTSAFSQTQQQQTSTGQ
jgi:type II secretory pathway pseudopilin PulG